VIPRLRSQSAAAMTRISLGLSGSDQRYVQSFQRNSDRAQTSIERLSTGKRINRPSDDPPGFVAAEGLRGELIDINAKLKGLQSQRTQNETQQSGLIEVQTALNDLSKQVDSPADITLSDDERAALHDQIDAAVEEVNRVAKLTGNTDIVTFNTTTAESGAANGASQNAVDAAAQSVSQKQSALAADDHARIDTFTDLYQDQAVIHQQAISEIEDTDFAAEATALTESQTLAQSSMIALAYAGHERASQITSVLNQLV
jgi:flagellin